jgi:purine-binding chemotaxis protein CheW
VVHALLLPVGADTWCLPMACVLEVVTVSSIRAVAMARPGALGVFNLRGDVVPLFDTAALLGLGPSPVAHAVVVDCSGQRAALTTSGVPRPVELGSPEGHASHPAAVAEYDVDGQVAVLLALDRLWDA